MEKLIFKITEIEANQRIDKYLKKQLANAPSSFIYRLFRLKDVKVDNKKVDQNYIIQHGEEISIFLSKQQKEDFIVAYEFKPVPLRADIIFENNDLLAVNKPTGLLVHSDINEQEDTLTNQVLTYLNNKSEFNPANRGYVPSPIGRIDKNTSGLVIFAKKQEVNQLLSKALHDNTVERLYLTLVHGQTDHKGKINYALSKEVNNRGLVFVDERGKPSVTHYKLLKDYGDYSLLEVKLETGRSNQIRVHLAHIAHPIVGDEKYGKRGQFSTLCLHHYKMKFYNMEGTLSYLNDKELSAPLPKDFDQILQEIEER